VQEDVELHELDGFDVLDASAGEGFVFRWLGDIEGGGEVT
jgi:hypothetical protein